MGTIKETTVHDMKTNFSKYAAELLDGTYDEIIVKNRTTPTLRIQRYKDSDSGGLKPGLARKEGIPVVSDDWDMNDGDDEIAKLFEDSINEISI